jgi:hypothetical protein
MLSLRCSRGKRKRREISAGGGKTSTLLPAHPVRSEVSKCAPAGLLAHRSIAIPLAFPRKYPQWPNKNEKSLTAYSCGGSCGFKPHSLFIALSREPMHDKMLCFMTGKCQQLVVDVT